MKSVKITNIDLNGFMPETEEAIPEVISDLEDGQALLDKVDNIEESVEGITLTEQEIDGQKTGKLIFTDAEGQSHEVQGGFPPDNTSIILTDANQLQAKGLVTQTGYLSGDVIKEVISAQGGYLDSHNFGTSTPTNQELTDYAIQNIETITQADEIWDKTRVINLYDHHTWVWDLNSETWSDLGEIAQISDANNDGLHGLVTGAPNDGYHNYMGNIDANGQININGLPELAQQVTNNTTAIGNEIINRDLADQNLQGQINNKQDKLTAGQNITIDENNIISTSIGVIDKYEVQDIVTEEMYDTHYNINTSVENGTYIGNSIIGNNGTAGIIIIGRQVNNYYPPRTVTVVNCSYNYDNETGVIELFQPGGNVSVIASCLRGYSITTNVQGGTYTGNSFIYRSGGTATITITPKTGFDLPSDISVSGCSYTYDSTTGIINLSNPSSNITIEVICESNEKPYITFECDSPFTLSVADSTAHWDGTLYVNTNDPDEPDDWMVWDGTTAISSQSLLNKDIIYVRGSGNTIISGNKNYHWVITPNNNIDLISMYGNIENLLDYQMVTNGQHPPMADHCFEQLFRENTFIRTSLALRGTVSTQYCYAGLYRSCPNIETISALPIIELERFAYSSMYNGCTKIKLSLSQDAEYQYEYRIPDGTETGTAGSGALQTIFSNTGGTFTGNATINTTYYTANEIVR